MNPFDPVEALDSWSPADQASYRGCMNRQGSTWHVFRTNYTLDCWTSADCVEHNGCVHGQESGYIGSIVQTF